jgi:hypothetical protein
VQSGVGGGVDVGMILDVRGGVGKLEIITSCFGRIFWLGGSWLGKLEV